MKRTLLYLMLGLALAPCRLTAQAAEAPGGGEELPTDGPGLDLLFYEVPGALTQPGENLVRFDVDVDGEAYLSETVRLTVDRPATVAVELLASEPRRLARLHWLMGKPDAEGVVRVSVGGEAVERFGWSEFLAHSDRIKGSSAFHPVVAPSDVTSEAAEPGRGGSPAPARLGMAGPGQAECFARCDAEFDQCEMHCDPHGGPNGCQACYDRFDHCRYICSQCPLVRTRTEVEQVGDPDPTGDHICLEEAFGPPNRLFQRHRFEYKRFQRETTVDCDGQVTHEDTGFVFFHQDCWRKLQGSSCQPSVGNEHDLCTFR